MRQTAHLPAQCPLHLHRNKARCVSCASKRSTVVHGLIMCPPQAQETLGTQLRQLVQSQACCISRALSGSTAARGPLLCTPHLRGTQLRRTTNPSRRSCRSWAGQRQRTATGPYWQL